jgi:poly(3-hydroxybutyrate) depolymerase
MDMDMRTPDHDSAASERSRDLSSSPTVKPTRSQLLHGVTIACMILGTACSSGSSAPEGSGGSPGTGGKGSGGSAVSAGTGGAGTSSTGGQTGSGGHVAVGSGGSASGGHPGSGGATASGGITGSGGTSVPAGSGGMTTASGGAAGGESSGASKGTGLAGMTGSGAAGGGTGAGGSTGAGGTGAGSAMKSAGCGKTRTLQNGTITIQSNGARTYILRVPDNYDNSRPYRLILAYHWSGANATDVASSNYFRHWSMANNSTIFAAPQGLDSGWGNTNGQDVTFTDAILAQIEGDLCIDTTRVFATGFSFGGGMCIALACARPNVFRAVAFFSGAELSGCDGGTMPIAYYASQASQDRGSLPADSPITGEAFQAKFAALNGCTAQNAPVPATGSGQPHVCTKYQGCSAGHPTEYCGFDGPHGWDPRDPGQAMGWDPEEAWKFITQF